MSYTEEKIPDEFHQLFVELVENFLPAAKKKGRFFARSATFRTVKKEDLAAFIVERRGTKWKYAELVDAFDLFCREICFQLCDGYAVNVGDLFLLYPHIKGMFTSLTKGIAGDEHKLTFHFRILRALYEAAEHIKINVKGLAGSGAFIDTFTDVKTELVNQKVTVGGQFVIEGGKVKIDGPDPKNGIRFVTMEVPTASSKVIEPLAVNLPHQIIGIIPDLPQGRPMRIEICTQYSSSTTLLKEPRILTSNFTVTT
ncbi:MAG: DUF4469 domain-containing protein [Spirochaetaceae bacterium]|jgi:hypothetical protein|nr:DUF4469 domain-containing protein [Spirochaetaceae bacterium]